MEKEINAAVAWWVTVMADPKQDNGDAMCNAMMGMCAESMPKPTNGNMSKFVVELRDRLAKMSEDDLARGLHVDYGPCRVLAEAAEAAGIKVNMNTFPCKTNMWIKKGSVEVSYGYGAPMETVELGEAS